MTDAIRLLEERVLEALERLRSVTRERDELREQLGALRNRLAALERQAAEGGGGTERAGGKRRAEAVAALRSALAELRGDGTAA